MGPAIMDTAHSTHNLVSVFMFMKNDGTITTPPIDGPTTGDCVFCQHDQQHVRHIERHVRDGILTTTMRRDAIVHYYRTGNVTAEAAQTMAKWNEDSRHNPALRGYLIAAVTSERRRWKGSRA